MFRDMRHVGMGTGFIASTADGFQGDERDVILLSTVYQPDMYEGGKWYITSVETRNLWNVAVSRARAGLHVFGNKEACKTCGAKHLVALAERSEALSEDVVHTGRFVRPRRLALIRSRSIHWWVSGLT